LREAVFRDLCGVLEQLLNDPALPIPNDQGLPHEKCHADRPKEALTLFGLVALRRNYYYSEEQEQGRAPLDQALGLLAGYSPGVMRMLCRAAAREPFESGAADLKAFAGLEVEGRQLQRVAERMGLVVRQSQEQLPPPVHASGSIPILYVAVDGTGVPMVAKELVGRSGKQPDGSARTREVKLGCVFTQTTIDEEGLPLRDYQSSTYVAGFEAAKDFMVRVRREAIRRRMSAADMVALLGDGAAWIWQQGKKCFPLAIQILDLYHALEHLMKLATKLEAKPQKAKRLWRCWKKQLLADNVARVLGQARKRVAKMTGEPAKLARKEVAYLERNQGRMFYATYRQLGFFYGSGVVEAGCKTVIGQRCKASGMLWSVGGAQNVLDLRCALYGNQFDEVWDKLNQSDYLRIKVADQVA
jgi:Uncharacterised protein family (UPF0236)